MISISHAVVDPLILPLVAPFAVSTRTAYEAKNVLLRLFTETGESGLGAGAPVEYVTGESIDTVCATLNTVKNNLNGLQIDRLLPLLCACEELIPNQPTARTILEMALLDLWGKHWRIPLWQYFGGAETELTSDVTIPLVGPEKAAQTARESSAEGFHNFKIKVGDPAGLDADYARLAAIAGAAPEATIRIDANQAFDPDRAASFVKKAIQIAPNIEMIEQPVVKEDIDGLRYVRDNIHIPLFADESAQSYDSVYELICREAVDGINIKLMKSGIYGAWRIASLCHARGIKLMIGCMLESRLSLTAACALVAGTGWFDMVDLDSHRLLSPSAIFTGGFADQGPTLRPETESYGWGVGLNEVEWNKHLGNGVKNTVQVAE